jgi:hypothetical protein
MSTTKTCIVCGCEIPEGRLKILPNTKTCVEHSTQGAYKSSLVTMGNVDKDEHFQEIEIIKDDQSFEQLEYYKKQQGNH